SPLWYRWVDKALHSYQLADAPVRDEKLLGLALFRPIHDELSGKGCIVSNDNNPFALQQPCSWGAVYFPHQWRYFRDWYYAGVDPLVSDENDNYTRRASSNTWDHKSSWKKYLIQLMYDSGWYMLYPNLPDSLVLSTNH